MNKLSNVIKKRFRIYLPIPWLSLILESAISNLKTIEMHSMLWQEPKKCLQLITTISVHLTKLFLEKRFKNLIGKANNGVKMVL